MAHNGHRIKQLRWDMGITQKQLAEATGIGYSTIQGYEQGTGIPSDQAAHKLAKFFSVTVAYLRGDTEDKGREEALNETIEAAGSTSPTVNGMSLNQALAIVDKLEKLVNMLKDGAITEEEYRAIKQRIIGK